MKATLEILKRDFNSALDFLKKKYRQPFCSGLLKTMNPSRWYMVIGASGVGKTSLLLSSGLNLVDIHDRNVLLAYPTQHCQWLFSKEAVFLDMTGRYSDDVWNAWFKQLSIVRGKSAIQGLIIAYDLKYSQLGSKQLDIIKNTLEAINPYIHNVPIYVVFTQCDYIAGFVEFFEDLGIEEQKEIFGFHIDGAVVQEDFLHQFEEKFDALIDRLNQRIIWRLHQERQIEKKLLIKHFPIQLFSLKDNCRALVKVLSSIAHLNLMGMYFTSSLQTGRAINYLDNEEKSHFPLASSRVRSLNSIQNTHKRFFITQLFSQILKFKPPNWHLKKTPTLHYFVYALSTLIFMSVMVFGYNHYQKGVLLAQDANNWLREIDTNNKDILKTLSQLNQTRTRLLKKKEEEGSGWLYIKPFNRLYQSIDTTYFNLLRSKFFKQLKQTLENELNSKELTASERYRALKVYLMLGDKIKRNTAFIQNWFTLHWRSNLGNTPKLYQMDLLKYLNEMLFRKEVISLNTDIIKRARSELKETPTAQIVFAILSAHLQNGLSDSAFDFQLWKLNKDQLPVLFRQEQAQKIYDRMIPEIYQKLLTGDEVLQETQSALIEKNQIDSLVQQTRNFYLRKYREFWKQLLVLDLKSLDSSQQDTFKKLARFSKQLANMDLTLLRENTLPIANFTVFNDEVSNYFKEINRVIQHWNKIPIAEALKNVNAYLSVVMDSHSGAFVAARMRMEDNGEKDPITQLRQLAVSLPPPLKESFNQLADAIWVTVLKQAHIYLNQKWIETVVPFYQERLKNRYPLFKSAEQEIALEDMGRFFSQEGLLTQFFERYIQFFVDQHNFYWQWKKVDDKSLMISQATLESFIRGSLIKKMFFTGNEKMPSFRFSMELTSLSGRVREGIFQFNDQYVNYFGNTNKAKLFLWPGQAPYIASIEMLGGTAGRLVHRVKNGPWALFRLIEESRLGNSLDSKRLNVVFDVEGETMKGLLVVDSEVNPLIQGILNAFRCPEVL